MKLLNKIKAHLVRAWRAYVRTLKTPPTDEEREESNAW